MKINLYNKDGATLWLEKIREIKPQVSEWKLMADSNHNYCLEYLRVTLDEKCNIKTIDPPGGPFLSVSDELDYFPKVFKILKITSNLTLVLSERNKNSQKYSQ